MTETLTRKVLVVDDDPDDCAELRSLLLRGSELRHTFTDAACGASALRALADHGAASFDCVLLDYHLPDMNAQELLAALRQPLGRIPCPVLVVTGKQQLDGRELMRAGAQDYIAKSWITPQSLTRAVNNAIERFAMQQEAARMQQALAQEGARLALALAAGRMGVYELNLADGALAWSRETFALFGVDPGVFVPNRASFRTLVHPNDRGIPWQALHDTVQPATPATPAAPAAPAAPAITQEFRIRRPDGQWRWLAQCGQTTHDADAGTTRHAGVVYDITERKRAEAEHALLDQRLRDQQFYTRSLIEASSDALIVTDPSGFITDVNQQMEALAGRTRDELVGTPFASLFSEPLRAGDCLAQALARRVVREHDDLVLLARDGATTPVSLNATTFFDRERVLQGVFFAARDVTQRRFLDAALQETHAVLETSRFLAVRAQQRLAALQRHATTAMQESLASICTLARKLQAADGLSAADQTRAGADLLRACDELRAQIEHTADAASAQDLQMPPARTQVRAGRQPAA